MKSFKPLLILIILAFFLKAGVANAQTDNPVTINFFRGEGCPHCADEERFLEKLKIKYGESIQIHDFEIWYNANNSKILQQVSADLGKTYQGIPVTVIGNTYINGYLNDETTGAQIEQVVESCLKNPNSCPNAVEKYDPPVINNSPSPRGRPAEGGNLPNLPFLGKIDTKAISLPVLAIIIGLLDGFNPCAMWTLLFLISVLLGIKSKPRRWILGLSFILVSGAVYFLFMSAWLNMFLFLGLVVWIRIAIGLAGIIFGIVSIRKYFKNREGGCDTAEDAKRQKVFEKIKSIAQKDRFVVSLIGIVLLAGAVNLVELLCSAGFPAMYTGILSMSNLPKISYYLYILLYICFFMLDDIVVFVIAMLTLEAVGIESKYSRISSFVGGIVILILGLLLIFKPGIVMLNF